MRIILATIILVALCTGIAFAGPMIDSNRNVTGLVIDASGLGLKPDIKPILVDSSGLVISNLMLAIPSWESSMEICEQDKAGSVFDGKSKAGNSYLYIKAVGIKNKGSSVIISADDADIILKNSCMRNVFQAGHIVIIR